MRKMFLLLTIMLINTVLINSVSANPSSWQWEDSYINDDGKGLFYDTGVATDSKGNVYRIAVFKGNYSSGQITLPAPAGSFNIFIEKRDGDGTLVWLTQIKSANSVSVNGLSVDNNGNVFVCGQFANDADFGNGISLQAIGSQTLFIAKYDNDGNALWAQKPASINFLGGNNANSLAVDVEGNAYITGQYEGTLQFGNLPPLVSNNIGVSKAQVFVVKYSSDGQALWALADEGGGRGSGASIAASSSGAIVLTGRLNGGWGSASFGGKLLDTQGQDHMFVLSLDYSGNVNWARQAKAVTSNNTLQAGRSGGTGIATDKNGHVYVTGTFSGEQFFGPTAFVAGDYDAFFVTYDANGTPSSAVIEGGARNQFATGIAIDESFGLVYITGTFDGSMRFSNNQSTTSGDATSGFVICYAHSVFPNEIAYVKRIVDYKNGAYGQGAYVGPSGVAAYSAPGSLVKSFYVSGKNFAEESSSIRFEDKLNTLAGLAYAHVPAEAGFLAKYSHQFGNPVAR